MPDGCRVLAGLPRCQGLRRSISSGRPLGIRSRPGIWRRCCAGAASRSQRRRRAAAARRGGASRPMKRAVRPLAGLATIVAILAIVAIAAGMFQGNFAETAPLTVLSQRAGLVMNPDAKVKLLGVQVGRVASIKERPNGQAAIYLALDPAQLQQIPANVVVDIASATVFGA